MAILPAAGHDRRPNGALGKESGDAIRLFHAERQQLRRQQSRRQPVRRRHSRRGALCRGGRAAFGLGRRASLQHAGRLVLPRSGAGAGRGAHQPHPACPGGDGAAAAPSDPGRRAMGDARPLVGRAGRFRRRARLRPARISAVRRLLRGQPVDLRGGHGNRPPVVVRERRRCRITEGITGSTMSRSRRARCSGRSPPMSPRSRDRRSSSPPGSAAT